MRSFLTLVASIVSLVGLFATSTLAQYGGSGMGGGMGMGGGGGGGTGALQLSGGINTFSTQGSFGSQSLGGGVGPAGNRMGGQTGASGQMGANGAADLNNLSSVGTGANISQFLSRQGQFVGGGANNSFIGESQLSGQNMNALGGAMQGLQGMRGNNQYQNRNNQNNLMNNRNTQQQNQPHVHVNYEVGFDRPAEHVAAFAKDLATSLSQSHHIEATSPITIDLDGQTAVLKGSVASEADRIRAGNIAMLEPGVYHIRNDLRVEPKKKASASELPAPSTSGRAR